MSRKNKNYKNSEKERKFGELFKSDIDRAYKIVAKAPKRLLFHPQTKYYQQIDEDEVINNILSKSKMDILTSELISYFNNYKHKNMTNINSDIDLFIPLYKKRYRYKKKHINRMFKYAKQGLKREASCIKDKWNEDPQNIAISLDEYKYILFFRYLNKK